MFGSRQETLPAQVVQPAILEELDAPEETLLIAFGSVRLERPFPPFEFRGAFAGIPAKKIFVRDPYQLWYQRGLPGIADTLNGVGNYLKGLVAEQRIRKVATFGGSMDITDSHT